MPRFAAHFPLLLAALAVGGCLGRNRPVAETRGAAEGFKPGVRRVTHASDAAPALDATPRQARILSVQVFALELPRGRVSRNSELWRRIDENRVGPGVYDVLWANGVRVGGAKLAELEHVRQTLEVETAQRVDIVGRSVGRQAREFAVEAGIGEKTLFWFDAAKRHHGRTFQRCETLMTIAFEPSPGRDDAVRISMTPVVRSTQARLVVTPAGDDYTVSEEKDTNLLDLNLEADVPLGQFLIVSPSDEATWETSLGRQFFSFERDGQLFERVYVLIPQVTAWKEAPRH